MLVAPHIEPRGARVIDATGLVVAPGFIDVHSHSESADQGLASMPLAENNVRQGVTTVFANPDGGGDVPITSFLDRVTAARPAINLGAFIGHGAIRTKVMGNANRAATAAELAQMRDLEKHVLSLEDAVRKMSSFPATRMRLADRGLVRAGMKADLAVLDPAEVKDLATFERPHQYAVGIHTVLVNGQVVLEKGKMTGARPGRVLHGPAYRRPQ